MKKLILITITVFLNIALFSCTPSDESFLETSQTEQGTTGDDGEILPDEEEDDGDNEN